MKEEPIHLSVTTKPSAELYKRFDFSVSDSLFYTTWHMQCSKITVSLCFTVASTRFFHLLIAAALRS